jgi:hypothetical protein
MFFEFRFYQCTSGRLAEEVARMHEVAIAGEDGAAGSSLFDQFGIPRPLGAWTAVSGARLPLFGYIVGWESLDQRDSAFPAFWADPRWAAVQQRTDAGSPMVERIETWLMAPSPIWSRAAKRAVNSMGSIHEMRIHRCSAGHAKAVSDYLSDIELPQAEVLGATVIGVFDVLIGPDMPAIVSFLDWPDFETHQAGWRRIDVEPRVHERRRRWASELGLNPIRTVEQTLLRPLAYGRPRANFGIAP